MDEGDRAQVLADTALAAALANRPVCDAGGDASADCVSCGCVIPLERRAAIPGAYRCVECQEDVDRLRAAHRPGAPVVPPYGARRAR